MRELNERANARTRLWHDLAEMLERRRNYLSLFPQRVIPLEDSLPGGFFANEDAISAEIDRLAREPSE